MPRRYLDDTGGFTPDQPDPNITYAPQPGQPAGPSVGTQPVGGGPIYDPNAPGGGPPGSVPTDSPQPPTIVYPGASPGGTINTSPSPGSYQGSIARIPRGQPQQPAGTPSASPSTSTNPYDYILAALNSGNYGNPQAAIDAMNASGTPGFSGYAAYYPSSNVVGIPPGGSAGQYGGYFAQDPSTGQWGFVQHSGPEGGTPSASGGAPAGGYTGPSLSDLLGPINSALSSFLDPYFAQNAAVRQMVQQRLQGLSAPVNENSPGVSEAVSAARDEATRQQQSERTALAENLYATGGLNTNAIPMQIQQSSENIARNVGGLRANLIMGLYQQRQQELDQLLTEAVNAGDTASAQAIQVEMNALQAALQNEGLGVNLAEFSAGLNQNAALAGLTGA